MYIDTHTHLYLDHFREDIDQVIQSALRAGVSHMYLPNVDSGTIPWMLELQARFPKVLSPMIGLHPGSVNEDFEAELEIVHQQLVSGSYVAIGEIGTDLYWDKSFRDQQEIVFEQQIRWALEFNLPIVIHARDSMDWTIDLVEKNQDGRLSGVFHCFTGTSEQASRIMELGFYLGIGGVLTYPKSGLKGVVSKIPLEHLVLETDAPYLPPVPYRGKRNVSAYIPLIAAHLAETLGCTVSEVAKATTENAGKLFNMKF